MTTIVFLLTILITSQSRSNKVWAQPPPDGVFCTMCSSCDNPCHPIPYPSPPPPPPPTFTHGNCPPPPFPTNTYYSPPPPATYGYNFLPPNAYNYPPRYGGGGQGYYRTPPPPNPIMPYFPFFFYSPPPTGKGSGSSWSSSAGTKLLRPFDGSSLLQVILSFVLLYMIALRFL